MVDESLIEKVYTAGSTSDFNRLTQLLEKIPQERVRGPMRSSVLRRHLFGKKLNDNIYLTLTDHISFAIDRTEQGLVLKNALLWEIKRFYNHEYLIGREALSMIEKRLGVALPDDEAGFIALHLVNASMELDSMAQTAEMTKIIQHIIGIVKYHFHMELNGYSLHYERFITHLKFFVQRVFNGTEINEDDKTFWLMLKDKYKKEYQCTLKIRDYMRAEFGQELTEDEMIFLTVHIKRVTTP